MVIATIRLGLLAILLAALYAGAAWAAPTHDVTSNSGALSNVQNPTYDHTRGAVCDNPVAIIRVTSQDSTPGTLNSVTYGGAAASLAPSTTHKRAHATDTTVSRSIWVYKNPPSGTSAVQPNFSEVMNSVIVSTSTYCGVDQTTSTGTGVEAEGASTAPSVNVSSASTELVVDIVAADTGTDTTLTVGASQTERANLNAAGNHRHGGSEEAGAATTTMSWTLGALRYWGTTAVALLAAPDGQPAMMRSLGVPGMNTYGLGGPLP